MIWYIKKNVKIDKERTKVIYLLQNQSLYASKKKIKLKDLTKNVRAIL